jgi:hypothetical protein
MRSPLDRRDSGHTDDVETTVQDTLDAFDTMEDQVPRNRPVEECEATSVTSGPPPMPQESHQESIDRFSTPDDETQEAKRPPQVPSRALEGLALEIEMERVALTEAAAGISRDELLLTIAREVTVPLERLDLVDGYLTDMELEGKVRMVGDIVVLRHADDTDLLAMDLTEEEFLNRYRRRYLDIGGGGRP